MTSEEKQRILIELGGIPEDIYNSLVHDMLVQTQEKIGQLKELIKNNDYGNIAQIAHSIKGTAGNLRIASVHEHAKLLEKNAKESKDNHEIMQLIDALEKDVSYFQQMF